MIKHHHMGFTIYCLTFNIIFQLFGAKYIYIQIVKIKEFLNENYVYCSLMRMCYLYLLPEYRKKNFF